MGIRILVVEDSRTQAEALRLLLEDHGYSVTVAPDGEAALDLVRKGSFDVVVSDITMPGISGYEVCRRIKGELRRRDLPVLLLTALSDPMDIVQGLEAGADSYVTKPYEPAQLLTRIGHMLKNRELRRGAPSRLGVNVTFLGATFTVNSEKEQILDLLISTFEDAVLQNRRLRQREQELETAKAQLARYADSLEERLQAVLDSVPDVVFSLSPDGRELHYVSPAVKSVFGVTPAEISADPLPWTAAIHPDDRPRAAACLRLAAEEGRPGEVEFRFQHPDGSVRWIETTFIPVPAEHGDVGRVDGVARDVTDRRSAEEAVRAQKEFLREIIDNSPNLIFVKDWNGRFDLANQAVADIYGTTVSNLVGKSDADFNSSAEEVARFLRDDREVIESLQPKVVAEESVTDARTDQVRWFQMVKVPLIGPGGSARQVLGVATDISERKRLEQQLRLAQKMEAVGTLAGGVAHDFNNLLATIRGTVDLGLLDLDQNDPLHPALIQIGDAVDRGAALTRQLLAFSRRQTLESRPVDMNALAKGMQGMLDRVIGKDIRLSSRLWAEPCVVLADPGQIEQVLMNLCVNARDAMPKGGELVILMERVALDEDFCTTHPWAREGDYVLLTVSDTGLGMDTETQSRIFEPFFTTKQMGHGTGLGLAVVYGIVKQHQGLIHVYSEPGKGTTFRIYLPFSAEAATASAPRQRGEMPGGHETILLAEDDKALQSIVARLLERLGYRVVLAGTGREALEILTGNGTELDAVILDVVMPELGGPAVFEQVHAQRPGLRFLFITGYSPGTSHLAPLQSMSARILQKPFAVDALARAVRETLDG
jgi:two-component system cell cycle sensor histidine kinase/response regulator CckA